MKLLFKKISLASDHAGFVLKEIIKNKLTKKKIGMSVCCDGVCLTVISFKSKIAEFYLSNETLKRSNFNRRKSGDTINLELPLRHGQDISGHVCQGHVDTVGKVTKVKKNNKSIIIDFVLTKSFKNQLIEKKDDKVL